MIDDLTCLLLTDPFTASRYTRSLLVMEAEAEATKVRITLATLDYRRALAKTHKKSRGFTRVGKEKTHERRNH